jgi:hypothetical protein
MKHPACRLLLAVLLFATGTLLVSCKGGAKAEAPYAGYTKAGFDKLAGFKFETPAVVLSADKNAKPQVDLSALPSEVRALSGQDVRLTGFMLPVKLQNGLVTEFLLVKDQASCCFGSSPDANHWVMVKIPQGVKNIGDMPVHVYGRLAVGPVFDTANFLIAIYSLEAKAAEAAPDVVIDNGQ